MSTELSIISDAACGSSLSSTTTATLTKTKINSKPALPPKPKLSSLAETPSASNSDQNSTNSDEIKNFNLILNSLKQKLKFQLPNPSAEINSTSTPKPASNMTENDLSLLDEIYAEIEDKNMLKPAATTIDSSQSCSSYSSNSSSSSDSSLSSISTSPPPLPNVPPPPLSTKDYDSIDRVSLSSLHKNRASLSLEEEIEIEIRAKLDKEFLFLKKPSENPKDESDLNKNEVVESIKNELDNELNSSSIRLEPEYLEPVLLGCKKTSNKSTEKNLSKLLNTSNQNQSFLLSPSKLKSFLTKPPHVQTQGTDGSNTKALMSYLIKTSTSTLRLMRTKSTINNTVLNDQKSTLPDCKPTKKCAKLSVNKRRQTTTCVQMSQTNTSQISRPTLISQTFDLTNQNMIEIKNSSETSNKVVYSSSSLSSSSDYSAAAFNSSSASSSSPSLSHLHQSRDIEEEDEDEGEGDEYDFDDSFYESDSELNLKLNLNSGKSTIETNTIITNVYEEDGKLNIFFNMNPATLFPIPNKRASNFCH